MKGKTNDYYQLYLKAKKTYCEEDVKEWFEKDYSDYKNIYEEIKSTLCTTEGIGIDSLHTRMQLVIEAKLSKEASGAINESLNAYQVIRDAVTDKVFDFSHEDAWVKAIHLAFLYYTHRKIQSNYGLPDEYEFIAQSLVYLKEKGFYVESIDGHINPNDPELVRLCTAIEYRVKQVGMEGFVSFMSVVHNNFSQEEQRFFFFRRRPTMPSLQKPLPPYGYVFNLFCKNLGSTKKIKSKELYKRLNEVQDLSTHLATILDLDKMSPWANINVFPENIIQKLTEWVLYPEVFYIPQISPVHGKKIFPRIFELIENNTEEGLSEIIKAAKIMERIEDYIHQQGAICGELTEDGIFDLCLDVDNRDNIRKILNSLSEPAENINKGYMTPFDAQKSNIREIPLIKSNNGYVVSNIATYNIAKYRALLKISLAHNRKAEQKLGFALEDFIKENFEKSHVDHHHAFEYLAPDYIREVTKTARDKGECDFIIESTDYVYLIEVKKKGLTKESQSGHSLNLLLDTVLSFLKSINQLTVAELILLKEGSINSFDGGKRVELNGRRIFKLVLSLEDMASLQCDNIKTSLMHGLYSIRINVSDKLLNADAEKINRILDEFTFLQAELMGINENYKHAPFHCVSYLSTPQLLTILEDVENNEDFSNNISRSNSIVYSLMDWYASYLMAKDSNLLNDHKDALKNTVLVN